ncbi:MAG TPA: hypothetical protein VEP91_00155 [Solirubrobacterales bacterium]|nr:hypothetical protein [Solirubrobacterales bacterium]
MVPKEQLTEERLDGLARKVGEGFKQVDDRFTQVDADIRELRGEMNRRFDNLGTRIDRLTFCLLAAAIGLITTHGL